MQFFDLIAVREDSKGLLARRLGYKKIFCVGEDVDIVEGIQESSPRRKILRNDDFETITKALKLGDVIGITPKSASVSGKTFDAIKKSEKVLFIAVSQVTCADSVSRPQRLARMRSLIRNTLKSKTPFSLVSLAEDARGIMSSSQALEVASFFGVPQKHAKESLGRLGGLV